MYFTVVHAAKFQFVVDTALPQSRSRFLNTKHNLVMCP